MGNEAFTEAQEKQIVEVIRATVAEVLRQQEAQKQHPASVQVFVRGIIVGSFKDLAHIGKIEIHEITPMGIVTQT